MVLEVLLHQQRVRFSECPVKILFCAWSHRVWDSMTSLKTVFAPLRQADSLIFSEVVTWSETLRETRSKMLKTLSVKLAHCLFALESKSVSHILFPWLDCFFWIREPRASRNCLDQIKKTQSCKVAACQPFSKLPDNPSKLCIPHSVPYLLDSHSTVTGGLSWFP